MQSDLYSLPAVFHAQRGSRNRAAEAEVLRTVRGLKITIGCVGREQVHNRLQADGDRCCDRPLELYSQFTSYLAAARRGPQRKMLRDTCFGVRSRSGSRPRNNPIANEVGILGRGALDSKNAAGKSGVFMELESFVVGRSKRWIKKKYPEGVTRPAIVLQKALQADFFDFGLFVGRSG